MKLFSKKKNDEPRPAVADMPSLFMNDDSEGNHGKEAMLDYQLSYLLRLANSDISYHDGEEFAKRVLMKLLEKEAILDSWGYVDNLRKVSVKAWKQWQHIDLIFEVDVDCGAGMEHHVIVVENKAYTSIHDDQLTHYTETTEEYYKDKNVLIHYWVITFFDNGTENYESIASQCRESKGRWKCLSFVDLIDLTDEEKEKGTSNEILDEFWVKKWF